MPLSFQKIACIDMTIAIVKGKTLKGNLKFMGYVRYLVI